MSLKVTKKWTHPLFEEVWKNAALEMIDETGFIFNSDDEGEEDNQVDRDEHFEDWDIPNMTELNTVITEITPVTNTPKSSGILLSEIINTLEAVELKNDEEEKFIIESNNIRWDCRAYIGDKIPDFDFEECQVRVDISPKNTQKTEALVKDLHGEFVRDFWSEGRYVFRSAAVVPRKTLAVAYKERVDDVGWSSGRVHGRPVENYMDHPISKKNLKFPSSYEKKEDKEERVGEESNVSEKNGEKTKKPVYSLNAFSDIVITLDSIDRILTPPPGEKQPKRYTRGIFDEFRSTIRHISAATVKSKNEIVRKLIRFFKLCDTLIFMDADFDQEMIDILSLLLVAAEKKDVVVRVNYNRKKTDTRNHVEYPTPSHFVDSMIGFLKNEWKADMGQIVCPCNTIYAAEVLDWAIRSSCPECKVLLITKKTLKNDEIKGKNEDPNDDSDSDDEEKEALTGKYSTEKWKGYDVIIYTSIYLVGVSYNEYVGRVYAYYPSSRSNCAAECAQMGFRARTALEVHYYCTGDPKTDALVEWCPEIQDMISEKLDYYYDILKEYGDKATRLSVDSGEKFVESILGYISRANELENRKSRQNLQREFRRFSLRHLEHPDLLKRLEKDSHYKCKNINFKEIKTTVSDRNSQAIADAGEIDEKIASKLKENEDSLTREESARLEKWKLMDFYNVDGIDIDLEFVKKWTPQKSSLNNFCLLFLTQLSTIEKRSEKTLEDKENDSIHFLALEKHQYEIFREMLTLFEFDMDKYASWRWDFSMYTFNLSRLNALLKKIWARTHKKLFVQIKSPNYVGRWVQRFMGDIGIPVSRVFKLNAVTKNDLEWRVNLPEFRMNLIRLETKFNERSYQTSLISNLLESCTEEKCDEWKKTLEEIKSRVSPPKERKRKTREEVEISNRKAVKKHKEKKKAEKKKEKEEEKKKNEEEKKKNEEARKEQRRIYAKQYRAKKKEQEKNAPIPLPLSSPPKIVAALLPRPSPVQIVSPIVQVRPTPSFSPPPRSIAPVPRVPIIQDDSPTVQQKASIDGILKDIFNRRPFKIKQRTRNRVNGEPDLGNESKLDDFSSEEEFIVFRSVPEEAPERFDVEFIEDE